MTDRFHYAPYGELVYRTGSTKTLFLFNGRYGVMTDCNGLYYMRARYYNPEVKRFINRDVVQGSISSGQSLNRYAYSNGNPISYIDPFGQSRDGDWSFDSFIDNTLAILDLLWKYGQTEEFKNDFVYPAAESVFLYQQLGLGQYKYYEQPSAVKYFEQETPSLNTKVRTTPEVEAPNTAKVDVTGSISRGSTARIFPSNLKEQLGLEQAMSNPGAGRVLPLKGEMSDPRWPSSDGWVKMGQNINGTEIHYVKNLITGAVDDFKIVK